VVASEQDTTLYKVKLQVDRRYGCLMDVLWMSYGCLMDVLWMSYGCLMDVLWMSYGCLMDVHQGDRLYGYTAHVAIRHMCGAMKLEADRVRDQVPALPSYTPLIHSLLSIYARLLSDAAGARQVCAKALRRRAPRAITSK